MGGWKTNRKIVVISVDDYGNVRLGSKEAREAMDKEGLKVIKRFDGLDTLETREDLEMLYEALTSVKDKNGNHAVFTPFAIPCNINFDAMAANDYTEYVYELLPETFNKKAADNRALYEGAWDLWKEGMDKGIMVPQFHGREHFNLKVFNEKLQKRDWEILTALKNKSYTSISSSGYPTIKVSAAFEFWDFSENEAFRDIIRDGLNAFEKVFGYRSNHFNSPGGREHPVIHKYLKENGIEYIDTPYMKEEHQGEGKYKRIRNYTGKKNNIGQTFMVRNVVFEPAHNTVENSVPYALKQVEAAFRWNKPAIISSHRVNYSGGVSVDNRKKGIDELTILLKQIVQKWPDVEFMAANKLGDLITGKDN